MKPRYALIVGLVFVVLGGAYFAAINLGNAVEGVDWAGITMLIALGAAMALMAYVLIAGSQRS
jgi:sugar phosphate permease